MRKLLVADDSVTIQKVVQLAFAEEELEIETASNGDQAIEKARASRPDVILADIFMPGRSGYELCETIKSDPDLGSIPVVLLVGTFEPFDEGEAARVGCDSYLTKPFDTSELLDVVHTLMEKGSRKTTPSAAPPQRPAAPASARAASVLSSIDEEALEAVLSPATAGRTALVFEPAEPETSFAIPAQPAAAPAQRLEPQAPWAARIEMEALPEIPAPSGLISERTRASFLGGESILDLFGGAVAPQQVSAPGGDSPVAAALSEEGTSGAASLPDAAIDAIAAKVARRVTADLVREVALSVVPEIAAAAVERYLRGRGNVPRD